MTSAEGGQNWVLSSGQETEKLKEGGRHWGLGWEGMRSGLQEEMHLVSEESVK